jgi:hypothetical protein
MKMIRVLETLFKKTMRTYWYSARYTGRSAGINEFRALIYSEIKMLTKNNKKVVDRDTTQRISELYFILAQAKKLTEYVD